MSKCVLCGQIEGDRPHYCVPKPIKYCKDCSYGVLEGQQHICPFSAPCFHCGEKYNAHVGLEKRCPMLSSTYQTDWTNVCPPKHYFEAIHPNMSKPTMPNLILTRCKNCGHEINAHLFTSSRAICPPGGGAGVTYYEPIQPTAKKDPLMPTSQNPMSATIAALRAITRAMEEPNEWVQIDTDIHGVVPKLITDMNLPGFSIKDEVLRQLPDDLAPGAVRCFYLKYEPKAKK